MRLPVKPRCPKAPIKPGEPIKPIKPEEYENQMVCEELGSSQNKVCVFLKTIIDNLPKNVDMDSIYIEANYLNYSYDNVELVLHYRDSERKVKTLEYSKLLRQYKRNLKKYNKDIENYYCKLQKYEDDIKKYEEKIKQYKIDYRKYELELLKYDKYVYQRKIKDIEKRISKSK
jgi:hypothetical protein